MPGVGLFPHETVAGTTRMIGDVLLECELVPGQRRTVAGFENHAGRTLLDEGAKPLGRVLHGFGNDGESGFEGCRRAAGDRDLPAWPAASPEPMARGLGSRAGSRPRHERGASGLRRAAGRACHRGAPHRRAAGEGARRTPLRRKPRRAKQFSACGPLRPSRRCLHARAHVARHRRWMAMNATTRTPEAPAFAARMRGASSRGSGRARLGSGRIACAIRMHASSCPSRTGRRSPRTSSSPCSGPPPSRARTPHSSTTWKRSTSTPPAPLAPSIASREARQTQRRRVGSSRSSTAFSSAKRSSPRSRKRVRRTASSDRPRDPEQCRRPVGGHLSPAGIGRGHGLPPPCPAPASRETRATPPVPGLVFRRLTCDKCRRPQKLPRHWRGVAARRRKDANERRSPPSSRVVSMDDLDRRTSACGSPRRVARAG